MRQPKTTFIAIAIAIFSSLVMVSSTLQAQETLTKFSIIIEWSGNQIKMTSNKGCAWKELSFTIDGKLQPIVIDANGVEKGGNGNEEKIQPSAFLFTVSKTRTGLRLTGVRGTSWIDLAFDCSTGNCRQVINQDGMVRENDAHFD